MWSGDIQVLAAAMKAHVKKPNFLPVYPEKTEEASDPNKIVQVQGLIKDLLKISKKLDFKLSDFELAFRNIYDDVGKDWQLESYQVFGFSTPRLIFNHLGLKHRGLF